MCFFMECDWCGCACDVYLFLLVFGALNTCYLWQLLIQIMIDRNFCVCKWCILSLPTYFISTHFSTFPRNKKKTFESFWFLDNVLILACWSFIVFNIIPFDMLLWIILCFFRIYTVSVGFIVIEFHVTIWNMCFLIPII